MLDVLIPLEPSENAILISKEHLKEARIDMYDHIVAPHRSNYVVHTLAQLSVQGTELQQGKRVNCTPFATKMARGNT